MKYININQKLKFKFCQAPRKILYTEPYKSILCPLSQLGYIFILDRLNLSRMNNKVDEQGNIYVFIIRKEMRALANRIGIDVDNFLSLDKVMEGKEDVK